MEWRQRHASGIKWSGGRDIHQGLHGVKAKTSNRVYMHGLEAETSNRLYIKKKQRHLSEFT